MPCSPRRFPSAASGDTFSTAFDQIQVGYRLSAACTFSAAELNASCSSAPQRLTSSLVTKIAESSFEEAVCCGVVLDFIRPVRAGEVVSLIIEVVRVRADQRTAELKIRLMNNGCLIACGHCEASFLTRPVRQQLAARAA